MSEFSIALYEDILACLKAGMPFCVVTVTTATGSTPRTAGAKMIVLEDGTIKGTIGGSLVERNMRDRALAALRDGKPRVETYSLAAEQSTSEEMICGGEMTFFLEPHTTGKHLYIFGAGHCGYALARAAAQAGFSIHVLDDRPEVATRERYPMAASITVGDYAEISAQLQPAKDAYITIMTQAHAGDETVLAHVLRKECRYIGMMASTRKREIIYKNLRGNGVTEQELEQVHSPVGLEIEAETPEEIAVSIVAELILVSRQADT
jgi:xanthine dehydrogenase accessory factor